MQCLWSHLRNVGVPALARLPNHARSARHSSFATLLRREPSEKAMSAAQAPSQFTPQRVSPVILSDLSNAQASRAASQAIRLSCQDGELRNAYLLLNSYRHSLELPTAPRVPSDKSVGLRGIFRDQDIFDFGRAVPTRLAAHTLLHGLIRMGLRRKACRLVENMMKDGITIRPATLEIFLRLLTHDGKLPAQSPIRPPYPLPLPKLPRQVQGAKVLTLNAHMSETKSTQFALNILMQARRYRQQRTEQMYETLINVCLMHGEIVVASLLFALVVKDWQLRKTLAAQLAPTSFQDATDEGRKADMASRLQHLRPNSSVYPSPTMMFGTLKAIEQGMVSEGRNELAHEARAASLQALANLAMLLDNRQLPFPHIAPLVHALMNCPRVDTEVWIIWNGLPKQVAAYSYFHSVIKRLIQDLPIHKPDSHPVSISSPSMLPPLNTSSYNTLLHYALRHRLSPSLADRIFHHMTKQRWPPLKADAVTYNILLRSGTLLREPGIVEAALQELRTSKGTAISGPPAGMGIASDTPASQTIIRSRSDSNTQTPATPDRYTLTSYITYLTSTGKAGIVAQLLFDLIPELCAVDHPSWGTLSESQRDVLLRRSREACIKRAIAYGPWFFAAVLNALRKAGKTGLAERVWFLAKAAERASWDSHPCSKLKAWYLPVHAYTAMMQCYAAESMKGLNMRRSSRLLAIPSRSDDSDNIGQSRSVTHQFVRGWALFIQTRKSLAIKNKTRCRSARYMGSLLFKSMNNAAQHVYFDMLKVQNLPNATQLPRPDARFYNAALDVFSRQVNMRCRSARRTRSHMRRQLRRSTQWYARWGITSKHWNDQLREVVESMCKSGYTPPPGIQRLAIGCWRPVTGAKRSELTKGQRPYAFPRAGQTGFRAYAIPTTKSRGLPCGRRRRWFVRPRTTEYINDVSSSQCV